MSPPCALRHCVWFRALTTPRLFVRMVFVKLIEFFACVEYCGCASLGYPLCHLGHRFYHIFIHHGYVARVAISTLTLLHLVRQQRATLAFSLLATLCTMTVSETYADPLKHWCLFMVVPTFMCPVLATPVCAFIDVAFLGLVNSVSTTSTLPHGASTVLPSSSKVHPCAPTLWRIFAPSFLVRLPRHRHH
jgi:hypothetical protein